MKNLVDTSKSQTTKKLLVCIDMDDGDAEFYDYQRNSWYSSPISFKLPNEQIYYQIEQIENCGSMLYAFGGRDERGIATNKVWGRDISQPLSQWTAMTPMNERRANFSSVVLDGTIYALGGKCKDFLNSCERYDSQRNVWETIASMNIARNKASTAIYNSCIYIAGGMNEKWYVKRSVERYDPKSNTWSIVSEMSTALKNFALTPFGRLIVIGDNYGNQSLSTVESHGTVSDAWQEEEQLNGFKWSPVAVYFNSQMYVVSGYGK